MKWVIIFLLSLFVIPAFSEQQQNKIVLRVGKHSDFIRFVLIFSDESIMNSTVVASTSERKIQVLPPSGVSLEFNGKTIVDKEVTADFSIQRLNDRYLIEIHSASGLKSFRLSSPPRIVYDVYFSKVFDTGERESPMIMIDPGHGGKDRGLFGKDFSEKDITLQISKDIATKLAERGISVGLTRAFDEDLPLNKRIKISTKSKLLLSIHLSKDDTFRIYYFRRTKETEKSKEFPQIERLIQSLKGKIERNFSTPVSIENLPLYLLIHSKTQTLLIELPNRTMSNQKNYNSKIVNTVAEAITEFSRSGLK